jgi:hypothetical protein
VNQIITIAAPPSPEDEAWAVATFNEGALPPATFAESVAREAASYRRHGSPIADFIAERLEDVVQLIALTDTHSPTEYSERLEIADDERRAKVFDMGYAMGVEDAHRELMPNRPE